MNLLAPHKACDGRGIATDDINELEMLRRRDEIWQELFRNAGRVHKAARSNAWLRPVFRKYKEVCRDILQQKKQEAAHFATLCDYCDTHPNAGPDMKLIREELAQIHARMENMRNDDGSSSSSSEMSDDSDADANEHSEHNEDNEDTQSVSSHCSSSSSSSSSFSSSSSSSSHMDMDMEDFL